MDITDEMLSTYVDGCNASGVADDEVDGLAVMRAGLRAVAPLIAAQALRDAAKEIRAAADGATGRAEGIAEGAPGAHAYASGLHDAAARLGKMARL